MGLALFWFTLVTAVIVTQWPFEYTLTRAWVAERWGDVDWSVVHRTPAGRIRFDRDFAQNLAMLFPLGLGYGLWRRAGAVRVAVESLLVGLAISVVLETAQLATDHRYTQLPDVWRNTLGCVVGGMVALAIKRRAPRV